MPPRAAIAGRAAWRAVAQLADGPLAFDLQADDEEEDGHQPVVDDVVEVLGEMERPDRDVDRCRPQRLVAGAPRRVRPHQRHRRGHRQQHPAGRLDAQELGQRASHPGQPGVTVKEGGRAKLPGGWWVHRWHAVPSGHVVRGTADQTSRRSKTRR